MPHTPETEFDIFRVRPSLLPYLSIIVAVSAVGALVAAGIFSLLPVITYITIAALIFISLIILLSWLTTVYALTNQRLEYRFGIIATKREFIEIDRISSVEFHQGILGKIFNYGDIVIEGDNPASFFNFKNIGNPKLRHDQIRHQSISG